MNCRNADATQLFRNFHMPKIVCLHNRFRQQRNGNLMELLKHLEAVCSESEDSSNEALSGPSMQSQSSAKGPSEDSDDDDNEEFIGPPLPPGFKDSDDDNDNDDTEEEDNNPVKKIPDSHEITLQHGTKTVSALGLDPSGARLITGGYDYDVKFWDFAGMDASLQAFRSLQPCECHQIKSLQYSSTGDVILVVSGNSQAKVLDRDGFPVMECIKGDQYIVDMTNTKNTVVLADLWGDFWQNGNDGKLEVLVFLSAQLNIRWRRQEFAICEIDRKFPMV
ncbi:WD repeat-containing protein 70 [Turdus rufiventris]|nr:WD repeat-containing protein 70 [Turdus rufiventris]